MPVQIGQLVSYRPANSPERHAGRVVDINALAQRVLVAPLFRCAAACRPEVLPLDKVQPLQGRRLVQVQRHLAELRQLLLRRLNAVQGLQGAC